MAPSGVGKGLFGDRRAIASFVEQSTHGGKAKTPMIAIRWHTFCHALFGNHLRVGDSLAPKVIIFKRRKIVPPLLMLETYGR